MAAALTCYKKFAKLAVWDNLLGRFFRITLAGVR